MKLNRKDFFEILPYIVAIVLCGYWIATGDKVRNDPYMLGLFRGIIWTPMIYSILKKWFT
jgi:hypothetical protein